MHNLIQYCIDNGLDKFIRFKFERKSRIVMREHFISNDDVIKYNLYLYVHKDKYGRYKMLKYVLRKISYICEILNAPSDNIYREIRESDLIWKLEDKMSQIDEDLLKSTKIQRMLKLKKLNNEHE